MTRPKLMSDELVLDKLLKTLSETGPDGLTFARAAAGVGLSAATLVQRYGSRETMVEATLLHAWDRLDQATRAADAEAPLTPAGAIDFLLRLMPEETAEHNTTDGLLLLREDIRNPTLRARGAAWGHYLASALGRRLTANPDHMERLGWQMAGVWQGALIWWAFTRTASPATAIRTALEDWCETAGVR
ncbi:TetR/AcrR family transcriptional regulator [Roseibium salinum]|uniref:TetR/AcrR family transcriptional regulator n=1 Tax=Roseibium salinum TaxID=1604349 RepID=A0ABT3R2N0_9HYPH|nr:TetR/AcrR family transcriptional regulator [Roseibium sp. DSM 29163]MCX2723489.1 TetR/AcrR family transcriptional regulator [Roseibium sp. DSM 29163]